MWERLDKFLSREFLLSLIPLVVSSIAFANGKIGFEDWTQFFLISQGIATGGITLQKLFAKN